MKGKFWYIFLILPFLVSCTADPAKVDVKLPKTKPKAKITTYTSALRKLGLMTEIFDTRILKVQMNPIGDETGAAMSTGAEIPRDITEMVKTALNSIGGRVIYVPYDPAFIQNSMVTGYSNFENKVIPDVVMTGAITEFDRGLVTRGKGTDVGLDAKASLPGKLPKGYIGFDYGDRSKYGLARITLDFNLIDFQTMVGIPLMSISNTMEVHKALGERELGITLFGLSFGRKGTIKKVQGRHDAVRVLVELSVVQMIGRYLNLPYWVLLGEDAQRDDVVVSTLKKRFFSWSDREKVKAIQELLYLKGFDISIDGKVGKSTKEALAKALNIPIEKVSIDFETYLKLMETIPINEQTLARRQRLSRISVVKKALTPIQPPVKKQLPEVQTKAVVQEAPQESGTAEAAELNPRPVNRRRSKGIGRLLKEEEW